MGLSKILEGCTNLRRLGITRGLEVSDTDPTMLLTLLGINGAPTEDANNAPSKLRQLILFGFDSVFVASVVEALKGRRLKAWSAVIAQ